jgi:quinol monooxygenase YgiN
MLVTYQTKPGLRSAFHQTILDEGLQDASRKEPGNLAYDYFLSVDHPDKLLLVEKWIDQAAIEHHKTLPHYLRLRDLKSTYIDSVSILITEISRD